MTAFRKAYALQLRRAVGLGCFLAWMYCSLFSCGLVPVVVQLCGVERSWVFAGIGQVLGAAAVLAVYAWFRGRGLGDAIQRAMGVVGSGCACVGSVLVWVSHLDLSWYAALTVAGGVCCGVGLALLALLWGARYSNCDEDHIESAIPLSFVVAFLIYFVLLVVKGPLFMVIDAILPVVSTWIAFRPHCGRAIASDVAATGVFSNSSLRMQVKHLGSLFALYFLLWLQFAFFRVSSSPTDYSGRFVHYLVPFSAAAVLAVAAFMLCMRQTRFLNFTFMYRWAVPLMIGGCAILAAGTGIPEARSLAYAVNFIAMFGVQMCVWIVGPKYVRRMGISPFVLFGGLIAAEGSGVAAGLSIALPLFDARSAAMSDIVLGITCAVAFVAMLVGFNPRWLFLSDAMRRFTYGMGSAPSKAPCESCASPCGEGAASSGAGAGDSACSGGACEEQPVAATVLAEPSISAGEELAGIFEQTACELRSKYGLTERETQIAALLLAGRSRPFIRDELVISLNTVHAHARSIYAKCNVHSQQEFMDFVHLDARRSA